MTFQLDTTGTVHFSVRFAKQNGLLTFYRWPDLPPFTQVYIEALLRSIGVDRFDAIAPETLARIIADCAAFENIASGLGQKTGAVEGGRFWSGRQSGLSGAFGCAFPPLTVQLGDDGKVRFA